MEAETDGALLYYMACRGSDGDVAVSNAAGVEFYRRHMQALYARCKRICHRMGEPESAAEDLAIVTLKRAVVSHGQFADSDGDPATNAGRTRAWLGQIAHNLMVDKYRNPNRPGPLTGIKEDIPFEDYSSEDFAALHCDGKLLPRDLETIRLAAEALDTLDARTRQVVMFTTLQRQRSPGGSYVYRGSAAAFAAKLGTTPVNVRRIYGIGIRAIAAHVDAHRRRSADE
jgi:DNA-directed RNA polymerase specialized sigma24 family protein